MVFPLLEENWNHRGPWTISKANFLGSTVSTLTICSHLFLPVCIPTSFISIHPPRQLSPRTSPASLPLSPNRLRSALIIPGFPGPLDIWGLFFLETPHPECVGHHLPRPSSLCVPQSWGPWSLQVSQGCSARGSLEVWVNHLRHSW